MYNNVIIQCDPNLAVYRVLGTRNNQLKTNRPAAVLFATRNIKIGEELTFNYKMVTRETIEADEEISDQFQFPDKKVSRV